MKILFGEVGRRCVAWRPEGLQAWGAREGSPFIATKIAKI